MMIDGLWISAAESRIFCRMPFEYALIGASRSVCSPKIVSSASTRRAATRAGRPRRRAPNPRYSAPLIQV
jgi:hypothetical protein